MKNLWGYISLLLVIVILFLTNCNSCNRIAKLQKDCDQKLVKADTVTITKTDTVKFDNIVYVPQPYAVKEPVPVYVDGKEVIREVDTMAILKDYYATRFYSDNNKITDSTGREVGKVKIDEQISENRILRRRVYGNLLHDSVTTTITNTIEAKKKNGLYFGLTGMGNKETIAGGVSLLFIQKKGFGIEAGALIDTKKNLWLQGSLKLKL